MRERSRMSHFRSEKKDNSSSLNLKPSNSRCSGPLISRLEHFQNTLGNRVLQRLLGTAVVQTNLRIGPTSDACEQEADRIADLAIRTPERRVR